MEGLCRGGLTPPLCTCTMHHNTSTSTSLNCFTHTTSTSTFLNCFMTNAQSILNKLSELQALVAHSDYHLIGITESWCTDSVNDSELHLKGYNLFRVDKKSGTGGGVLLYLHESLSATLCVPFMNFDIDNALWCSVKLKDKQGTSFNWYCLSFPLFK